MRNSLQLDLYNPPRSMLELKTWCLEKVGPQHSTWDYYSSADRYITFSFLNASDATAFALKFQI